MKKNKRFAIVTIILSLILLPVGVSTAYEQRVPTDSGTGRPDSTPVPPSGGATQGPPDVHPETRQDRPPGEVRQTRPSGSSYSSFPGPFSDLQSAIKVQPQNQVNTKSNTPCGSPKCLGEALTTHKLFTSQVDGIGKGPGNVVSPKVQGAAGRGRR
jgi:hypothetical protein